MALSDEEGVALTISSGLASRNYAFDWNAFSYSFKRIRVYV